MLEFALRRRLEDLAADYIGWPITVSFVREIAGADAWSRAPSFSNSLSCARWLVDQSLRRPDHLTFVRLISAIDGAKTEPEVWAIIDEIALNPSKWSGSPTEDLWVPARWPFIDRDPIRSRLDEMADGAGHPVITVDAPKGHGKRTLCTYIENLAKRRGTFVPEIAELRQQPGPGTLEMLVDNLRNAMSLLPDTGTTHEEPERQAEVFASNLALQVGAAKNTTWFVANVVDSARLDPGVLSFVDYLMRHVVETPGMRDRLRVIVLADGVTRLGLEHLPPVSERHVLTSVTKDHISVWLSAAVPGRPEDHYRATADLVVRNVDSRNVTQDQRLRWLSRFCGTAHQSLAAT